MRLHILVALTSSQKVMGKNNDLPWRLPEDLKRFKRLTMGHPILMGRKTFDSIGRPLPGRENIVLSRNRDLKIPGCHVFENLETALAFCRENLFAEKAFVIGGAEILKQALPLADELNLTWIDKDFEGDVFFPDWDLSTYEKGAEETHTEPFPHRYVDYFAQRAR